MICFLCNTMHFIFCIYKCYSENGCLGLPMAGTHKTQNPWVGWLLDPGTLAWIIGTRLWWVMAQWSGSECLARGSPCPEAKGLGPTFRSILAMFFGSFCIWIHWSKHWSFLMTTLLRQVSWERRVGTDEPKPTKRTMVNQKMITFNLAFSQSGIHSSPAYFVITWEAS